MIQRCHIVQYVSEAIVVISLYLLHFLWMVDDDDRGLRTGARDCVCSAERERGIFTCRLETEWVGGS